MNSTAVATRQAQAIEKIARETARLGGEFVQPVGRVSSPAARTVLLLEAIAGALESIGGQESGDGSRLGRQESALDETVSVESRATGVASKGKRK